MTTITLESLRGRIGDLDSHESIPVPRYGEVFGEIGQRFIDENKELWQRADWMAGENGEDPDCMLTRDRQDNLAINQENVWTKKGTAAPGAVNMDRRKAAMDEMGIERQLIFPMMGIFAWIQAVGGGQAWVPVATKEQIKLGKLALDEYNKWAAKLTKKNPGRMWVNGILPSGDPEITPELMIKKTEHLIASGCKAINMSSGEPPAGLSPGDAKLDPFYDLLAKENVTLTFHPPSGMAFRKSEVWEASFVDTQYGFVTIQHIAEENFIACMVLSGVFQRHPNLRVAVVETGADWVGPLAERMDFGVCKPIKHTKLPMLPSEYLSRNVRVSVMYGERVDLWLNRWPNLQDVYCYSSDYPHYEGGHWSNKVLFERVAPLGDDIIEKFFVKNSEWVLPAMA